MYGLPGNFDPSVFVGAELLQISFTFNQLMLNFSSDLSIAIESSLLFRRADTAREIIINTPVRESDLMILIGDHIVRADYEPNGTLYLYFSTGNEISIFDDCSIYESYQIKIKDKIIII
ncbi:conserved hypothetical protein [Gammaproteobacteria bacterium]